MTKDKWVIFDLDGTLADIETRRKMATKSNGKMDWDVFFADKLVELDDPNQPVIDTCKALAEKYNIAIFSGRSKATKPTTMKWLEKHGVRDCVSEITHEKPRAKFYIDDKAIEFKNNWDDILERLK